MKKWVTERSSKILFQEKWYTDKSAHVLEELIFHTIQGNIPIQYNSIKIPMAVFIKKYILKIHIEPKKALSKQSWERTELEVSYVPVWKYITSYSN